MELDLKALTDLGLKLNLENLARYIKIRLSYVKRTHFGYIIFTYGVGHLDGPPIDGEKVGDLVGEKVGDLVGGV